MIPQFKAALRNNYFTFVRKGFRARHGANLEDPYAGFACEEFGKIATGETKRLVVNMPPRHGKTFMG